MSTAISKILVAGAKIATAAVLAVLTVNFIAKRVANCPTVFDPELGRVPKPGAEFYWQVEGDGQGVWTSNCVRRASLPIGTNEGTILVLGDSFTEALHVKDEEHFAHLLEKRLFAAGINRPVLAVGRSGYSIADYAAKAQVFRKRFSPSWVIIQVGYNDFCGDAWEKSKPGGYAYFKQSNQQEPLQVVAPRPQNSGITGYVSDRYPSLLPITRFAQERKMLAVGWLKDNEQPWFHAQAESSRAEVRPSIATYPLENEIRLLAECYDYRLTLFYLPPFDPELPEKETEDEALLRSAAAKCGVSIASLSERFRQLADTGRVPYGFGNSRFNQGHWNPAGHAATADILFSMLSN